MRSVCSVNHLFEVLLQMTLHMSPGCRLPYRHICRELPRSANFFLSISSQENSLIEVTHCQNVLLILFIQCFAGREAHVTYQSLNCSWTKPQCREQPTCPWWSCQPPGPLQGPLCLLTYHKHVALKQEEENPTLIHNWVGSTQPTRGQTFVYTEHINSSCIKPSTFDSYFCHFVAPNFHNSTEEGQFKSYPSGFNF